MVIELLLAAIVCTPVEGFPTPALEWDHDMVQTDGYRVYWRDPDEEWSTWHLAVDLPITPIYNDAGEVVGRWRYGDWLCGLDWPIQRGTDVEAIELDWMVRAYNSAGESTDSPTVRICMPKIWQPGEAYE